MRIILNIAAVVFLCPAMWAQHQGMQMPMPEHQQEAKQQKPPNHANEHASMHMHGEPHSLIEQTLERTTSGTSAEPASSASPMLMTSHGKWMLMFHANAFIADIQQSGPRGADKFFSTNWFMPMAQRELGRGQLTLRFMASLEPATVTKRYYPELFQQGETAFGKPIVDGQHPHDFIMELAAIYDLRLNEKTLLSFYFAPMGDPAMGPMGYAHRSSSSEDPIAPLGHHLQDSTHIADDVITLGLTHRAFRIEGSVFHGREPDEQRWDLDSGKIDSWSARATINPAQNWSTQYSFASLKSPEALHPDENIHRMTVSVMYNRPLARGDWASTLLWGRNLNLSSNHDRLIWNSYLAESTLRFAEKNRIWSRIENVDRTSELLSSANVLTPTLPENIVGRVQAVTAGYDRDVPLLPHIATALGAQITGYGVPDALKNAYGPHPFGVVVFLHLRPAGHLH